MQTMFVRGFVVAFVVAFGSVAFAATGAAPSQLQGGEKTKCVAECVAKAAECVKKHAGHKAWPGFDRDLQTCADWFDKYLQQKTAAAAEKKVEPEPAKGQ